MRFPDGLELWRYQPTNTTLFFLCTAVTCFVGTFCLLISCLVSLSTGGIISKTIYELIYHSVAFLMYLVAAILLIVLATDYRRETTHPHMISSVSKNFGRSCILNNYCSLLIVTLGSRPYPRRSVPLQCRFGAAFLSRNLIMNKFLRRVNFITKLAQTHVFLSIKL